MTTILIVDDEFLIADILSYALEDEGYETVTASNGKKALEVLAREIPALVITDFMMPVMTGFELAMAIRQTPSLSALPICLMTGAQAAEASAHPELFDVIFGKPFNIEQVVQKVREFAPPVPLI